MSYGYTGEESPYFYDVANRLTDTYNLPGLWEGYENIADELLDSHARSADDITATHHEAFAELSGLLTDFEPAAADYQAVGETLTTTHHLLASAFELTGSRSEDFLRASAQVLWHRLTPGDQRIAKDLSGIDPSNLRQTEVFKDTLATAQNPRTVRTVLDVKNLKVLKSAYNHNDGGLNSERVQNLFTIASDVGTLVMRASLDKIIFDKINQNIAFGFNAGSIKLEDISVKSVESAVKSYLDGVVWDSLLDKKAHGVSGEYAYSYLLDQASGEAVREVFGKLILGNGHSDEQQERAVDNGLGLLYDQSVANPFHPEVVRQVRSDIMTHIDSRSLYKKLAAYYARLPDSEYLSYLNAVMRGGPANKGDAGGRD